MAEIRALLLFSTTSYRVISPESMRTWLLQTAVGLVGIIAFAVGLSTLNCYFVERPGCDLLRGCLPVPGAAPMRAAVGV